MKILPPVIILFVLMACKEKKNIPDVTAIKIDVKVKRFEQDFFRIDTSKPETSLDNLQQQYPKFLNDYLYNILGTAPQKDSVLKTAILFSNQYRQVFEASQKMYINFEPQKKVIQRSFQFIHYYFPQYPLPNNIITFIGPFDGTANALTTSGLAIGLQSYLGKDYPAYQSTYISQIYPAYKSKNFEAAYIPVNSIKNIIDDIYPDKSVGKPLIERMIEVGKRVYLLDAFMPETNDTLKTGYTAQQWNDCINNEKNIWSFFVQNNLLYETEPSIISIYVTEGPGTPELSSTAPGFIGQFTGWQIVKKWMKNNNHKSLEDLLKTPAQKIFNEARYKP
jgi:hypothetical protein